MRKYIHLLINKYDRWHKELKFFMLFINKKLFSKDKRIGIYLNAITLYDETNHPLNEFIHSEKYVMGANGILMKTYDDIIEVIDYDNTKYRSLSEVLLQCSGHSLTNSYNNVELSGESRIVSDPNEIDSILMEIEIMGIRKMPFISDMDLAF